MNNESHSETTDKTGRDGGLGPIFGFLLVRIWLAVRALQTGIEKFSGTRTSDQVVEVDGEPNDYGLTDTTAEKVYGLDHMQGVPAGLYDRLASEPLIPQFGLTLYDKLLGPLLIVLGITLLLGLFTRCSLFVMGLVYTSLTFGLILIGQDAGIAWLGIHILLVAFALFHVHHNRLSVMKKL